MDPHVAHESMTAIFEREVTKRIYVYYGFAGCYRFVSLVYRWGPQRIWSALTLWTLYTQVPPEQASSNPWTSVFLSDPFSILCLVSQKIKSGASLGFTGIIVH